MLKYFNIEVNRYMTIFNALSLVGGLALFLFGMNYMGSSLENSAEANSRAFLPR